MTEPDDPMYDEDEQGSSVHEEALIERLNEQEERLQELWDSADSASPGSIKRLVNEQSVANAAEVLYAAERCVQGYKADLDLSRPEDEDE